MKVCNYCGTGMDNSAEKCPFCRMEMNIRGAVKYQDDRPFDGSGDIVPQNKKEKKSAAELRYESSHKDDFSSNLKEKFRKSIEEAAEKKSAIETSEEAVSETVADTNPAPQTPPVIRWQKRAKTPQSSAAMRTLLIIIVLVSVFGSIITQLASGDFWDTEPEDGYYEDEYYDEYYIGMENFEFGEDLGTSYVNDYTGLAFNYGDWYTELDQDKYELTYIPEFYAAANDGMDSIQITYANKDFFGEYKTADEYLTFACQFMEENNEGVTKVSDMTSYLGEKQFEGRSYKIGYDEYYEMSIYKAYLVGDVTEDYYAEIEITAGSPEAIDNILARFN